MKKLAFAGALALAAFALADPSFAQAVATATPAATAEPVQPWAVFLQPYVTILLQTLAGGALTLAAVLANRWFGIVIDAAKLDRVKECAKTQVGVMVAGAADNLKNTTVDVHSTAVRSAADTVIAVLPGLIKDLGLTPESVNRIVAGEIGKMQAASPAIAAPAVVQTGDSPLAVAVEGQSHAGPVVSGEGAVLK